MDNPRPEKVAVVEEVREHFRNSDAAILTEYRGLKVKDLATLRRSLRPNGGEYKIYKNTLVTLAARDASLEDIEPMLRGPTGIAFVKGDAAAVAKALRDYARTNPLLVIKGGVLGEKVLSSSEATALAELPSREVLLAQLAGAFAAPLQQLGGLLQALPRNLAYGLAALRDKVAAGEPPAPGSAPAEAAAEPSPPAAGAASEPEAPAEPSPPAAEAPAEPSPAAAGAASEPEAPAEASASEPSPAPAESAGEAPASAPAESAGEPPASEPSESTE
jgi:large subunit ribosomal protein L10